MARGQERFHPRLAQAASRHVGDAQEADIVVGVEEHFQVGEQIAHFAPIKEALPANEVITDAGLAQSGFQRTRLDISAK